MTRLGLTALVALASFVSLTGAPAPKFSYYLTGNAADVAATTEAGLGLMGGGTDVDALFTWMSARAGGGDFVVIRASGADGYNQYVYDLGDFDSVETLVLRTRAASSDAFVLQTIRNADALFIAGGDQSDYVNNWKGTPVEAAIHELAARGVPIGGTSAGTAILGEFLYSAQRKSVTSAVALADPFSRDITLDRDFLVLPHLAGLITDQHLIERDRLGRTLTFMARLVIDGWTTDPRAIAIDRETAVLVDADGQATVVANAVHADAVCLLPARRRATGRVGEDAADLYRHRGEARRARQHVRSHGVARHRPDVVHAERQRRHRHCPHSREDAIY